MAVESIIDAVRGWENSKRTGTFYPLVLAIAGPIGVGKSETGDLSSVCKSVSLIEFA